MPDVCALFSKVYDGLFPLINIQEDQFFMYSLHIFSLNEKVKKKKVIAIGPTLNFLYIGVSSDWTMAVQRQNVNGLSVIR